MEASIVQGILLPKFGQNSDSSYEIYFEFRSEHEKGSVGIPVPNVRLVEICHCRVIFDYFATGDTELIICNYHDLS